MLIQAIKGKIKTIRDNPLEYASKAIGVTSLSLVTYDAHMLGKEKAAVADRIEAADRFQSNYKQYMSMSKPSQSLSDFKSLWFSMKRNLSFPRMLSKMGGYIKGVARTILSNLPEIGLSILALTAGKNPRIGKISAALLCASGIKSILSDIIGVEK